MAQLIGPRNDDLTKSLKQATEARNKIFHGQITELGLGRATLLVLVHDLREWCTLLGQAATALVGYDGFGRDSYRKGADATLHTRFAAQIKSVAEYETFLKSHVERPRKAAKKP